MNKNDIDYMPLISAICYICVSIVYILDIIYQFIRGHKLNGFLYIIVAILFMISSILSFSTFKHQIGNNTNENDI